MTKTLLHVSVEGHGQPLHLYVTHLEAAPTAAGEQRRFAAVKALLTVLAPQAERPQILCGDFKALSPKDSSEPPASLSSEAGAHAAPLYQVPRLSIPQLLDAAEIRRRIQEQYALVEALQEWLDRRLPN